MLAARAQAIARLKESPVHAHLDETALLGKLMAYCSRESHSAVEKDAMICFVKLRILEPDEKNVLRGETLRQVYVYVYTYIYVRLATLQEFSRHLYIYICVYIYTHKYAHK